MKNVFNLLLQKSVLKIPLSEKIKPLVTSVLLQNDRAAEGLLDERLFALYVKSNLINIADFDDDYSVNNLVDFSFLDFFIDVKSTASKYGYQLQQSKINEARIFLRNHPGKLFVFILVSRDSIDNEFYYLRVNEMLVLDRYENERRLNSPCNKYIFNINKGA